MKLIYIEWCDCFSANGWFTKEETDDWLKIDRWVVKECGFLLKETNKYSFLFNNLSDLFTLLFSFEYF